MTYLLQKKPKTEAWVKEQKEQKEQMQRQLSEEAAAPQDDRPLTQEWDKTVSRSSYRRPLYRIASTRVVCWGFLSSNAVKKYDFLHILLN